MPSELKDNKNSPNFPLHEAKRTLCWITRKVKRKDFRFCGSIHQVFEEFDQHDGIAKLKNSIINLAGEYSQLKIRKHVPEGCQSQKKVTSASPNSRYRNRRRDI